MTEQQLARMAKRRLAILRHAEEITGNVSLTCRYYGISRQVFYKWRAARVSLLARARTCSASSGGSRISNSAPRMAT